VPPPSALAKAIRWPDILFTTRMLEAQYTATYFIEALMLSGLDPSVGTVAEEILVSRRFREQRYSDGTPNSEESG